MSLYRERLIWIIMILFALFFGSKFGRYQERASVLSQHGRDQLTIPDSLNEPRLKRSEGPRREEQSSLPAPSLTAPSLTSISTPPFPSRVTDLKCPPCECTPKPKPKPKRLGKRLPKPRALNPLERAQLLAWARRNSARLKRCRDAGMPIYRLTASIRLKEDARAIAAVSLSGEGVPQGVRRCIERAIRSWSPPRGLSPRRHPDLVFGLQLD
jgi:hypothetical protein